VRALGGHGRKEGVDFLPLEEPGFRGSDTLHRDRRYSLGDCQQLRLAPGEILKEGVEACHALIPGPDLIAASVFQVADEPEHALEAEVVRREPRDPAPGVLCEETKKQSEDITIASHRGRTEPLHGHEPIGNERMDEGAERRCHVDVSASGGAAKRSKRRLASCKSSGVMVK